MTSRPKIPPSTGRPRLPISMDEKWRDGHRALPSPTSPTSSFRSPPRHLPEGHPHYPYYEPAQHHPQSRYRALPPPPGRRYSEDHRPSGRARSHMIPPAPVDGVSDRGQAYKMDHHPSFWSHHDDNPTDQHQSRIAAAEERPVYDPSRSLSATELPRLPNGLKKQQSGRRRTACDRCKRIKSSCVEAVYRDPLTGERGPHPSERRCQRCVEKGVMECTITTNNDSYARPRTPLPPGSASRPTSSSSSLPTIPAPLPQFPEGPTVPSAIQSSLPTPTPTDPRSAGAGAPDPSAGSGPEADLNKLLSPKSESRSSTSVSGMIWNSLFEQDAMVRSKQRREVSPCSNEGEPKGRVYYGNSHMEPAFARTFVASVPRPGEEAVRSDQERKPSGPDLANVSAPTGTLRAKRPDYRAEKLLKHLPGNEKEMDRYVDRFLGRYNSWADVIDESDFLEMYNAFKRQHCFGHQPDRAAADLRDLALLFVVLAFGVVLDHTPTEEVAKQNASILKAVSGEEERRKVQAFLREKDAASMTLNRREEMSASWASSAKSCLVDAQTASMGETINSISAWVLVAWYAIHGRQAEEGWSVLGQAARQAMASGFHIDGSHRMFQTSEMPPKEQEQRRRLWAQMVIIDTSVSLYLGRPHAIFGGQQYTSQEPANIAGEELNDPPLVSEQLVEDAADRQPWQLDLSVYTNSVRGQPLDSPTRSTFLILHLRLAYVIGRMQLQCFGLKPRKHERDVVECEALFESWSQTLPPHFRIKDTDRSLDDKDGYEWLTHQRKNLHSKYYIARISLHRPYLLATDADGGEGSKPSDSLPPNPYESSQDACMLSAIADLNLRTQTGEMDPLDRFKWMTVASGFNPALIMGIVCFYNAQHHKYKVEELLQLLSKYLEVESKTLRKGPVLEEELKALKFLHKSAKVHIKLGDRAAAGPAGDASGVSARIRSIAELGVPESEREAKRPRVNLPFTTSTPLLQNVTPSSSTTIFHPPVSASTSQDGPIPLPVAHHSQTTLFSPQTATSTSSSATITAGPNMAGASAGIHPGQAYFPHVPCQNIPLNLQASIGDLSSGDRGQMFFSDFNGVNIHSQLETFRPYHGAPAFLSTGGGVTLYPTVNGHGNGSVDAHGTGSGQAVGLGLDLSDESGREFQAVIAASLALPPSLPSHHSLNTRDQVLTNFSQAVNGISPEQQLAELPFINSLMDSLGPIPSSGNMPNTASSENFGLDQAFPHAATHGLPEETVALSRGSGQALPVWPSVIHQAAPDPSMLAIEGPNNSVEGQAGPT